MNFIVVGKPCSGKTEAGRCMAALGFRVIEASHFARLEMERMQATSVRELFARHGRDAVAVRICEEMSLDGRIVITGFRTPEEVAHVKALLPCAVVCLVTSDEECYRRARLRAREGDSTQDFLAFYRDRICEDYSLGLADIVTNLVDSFIDNESCDPLSLGTAVRELVEQA